MDGFESARKSHLVWMFDLLCQQLELTRTQFEDAESKYRAVGTYLTEGGEIRCYDPIVSPQGSMAYGTTVRPFRRNEFDLDFFCNLQRGLRSLGYSYVKGLIGDRLKLRYQDILEDIKKGWRLKYANQFYMDVIPAVPNHDYRTGEILIPDKDLRDWTPSNPIGYRDWFEEQARLEIKALSKKAILLANEARLAVDPLPEQTFSKSILKRAVQLFKRHRDVYFEAKEFPPTSIIITTLAAHSYRKLALSESEYENEYDVLLDLLTLMPSFVKCAELDDRKVHFEVLNPATNEAENFTDRWNKEPAQATAFYRWMSAALNDARELQRRDGADNVQRFLAEKWGVIETNRAFTKHAEIINEARSSKSLRISPQSGIGLKGLLAVPPNTFFGK